MMTDPNSIPTEEGRDWEKQQQRMILSHTMQGGRRDG